MSKKLRELNDKAWKVLEEYFNQPEIEITYKVVVSKREAVKFNEEIEKAFMNYFTGRIIITFI